MKGEELGWFDLASHLGCPVEMVKQWTTSRNFIKWMVYLDRKADELKPEHFYLAQIAAEVRRSWVVQGQKKSIKIDEFLKPYKREKEVKKQKPKKRNWKEKMNEAKAFFFGLTGYSEDD